MMLLPSITFVSRDDTDVRLEARRQVHELRRRARVQPELVDDGHGAADHADSSITFSPRNRSDATQIACAPVFAHLACRASAGPPARGDSPA